MSQNFLSIDALFVPTKDACNLIMIHSKNIILSETSCMRKDHLTTLETRIEEQSEFEYPGRSVLVWTKNTIFGGTWRRLVENKIKIEKI